MKNGYVRCERCRKELPKSMIEGAIEPWYRIKKIVEMNGKERGRSLYLCSQCTYDFNEWLYSMPSGDGYAYDKVTDDEGNVIAIVTKSIEDA